MTTTASTVSAPVSAASSRGSLKYFLARWALPILLFLIVVIAGVTTPGFLTFDNTRAILINTSIVGIVAVGMTPVTLSGNFFSLGATYSTMLAAVLFIGVTSATGSVLIGAIASIVVLLLVGVAQGFVVAAGLNPVITTLAVGSIIYGLVTLFTNGEVITPGGADISWIALSSLWGLPLPVYIFLAYTILTTVLVDRTVIGRRVLLLGANRESARTSGISSFSTTTWAFLSMSLGMAVAGILAGAQLQQIQSNDLSTLTLDTVAAVLVGGTSIAGGEGSPVRSAIGALLIVILANVMLLHGLPTGYRLLGVGILAVIVVSLLQVLRKVAAR